MPIPIFMAHGSLGNFDELIFLGVAVVFLVMMGISWLKSQQQVDQEPQEAPAPETPPQTDAPDRFKLD